MTSSAMAGDGTPGGAHTDTSAATRTQEPEDTSSAPEVKDAPPISKWPWWVSAAAAAVVLIALGVAIYHGWNYVVSHNETEEGEDYEQLLNLIDRVQNVALFVLGAILGVTVSGSAAAGAATTAKQNKDEALRQHETAKKNEQAANQNKAVARTAGQDAVRVANALDAVISETQQGPRLSMPRVAFPVIHLTPEATARFDDLREDDQPLAEGRAVVVPEESFLEAPSESRISEARELVREVRQRWEA